MLRRTPPKPPMPNTSADVHIALLNDQRQQAVDRIDTALRAHAQRHSNRQPESLSDVLLDLRNILHPIEVTP